MRVTRSEERRVRRERQRRRRIRLIYMSAGLLAAGFLLIGGLYLIQLFVGGDGDSHAGEPGRPGIESPGDAGEGGRDVPSSEAENDDEDAGEPEDAEPPSDGSGEEQSDGTGDGHESSDDAAVGQQPPNEGAPGESEAVPVDKGSNKPSAPEGARVTFAFAGDVQMAGKVDDILRQQGYDYPYSEVKSWFQQADIGLVNLETPVTTRGQPVQDKTYVYRSSPKALPPLAEAGIDVVNLANNHVLDQGIEGLVDTKAHLEEAGIQYMGAGMNEKEAFLPVILDKHGIRVAILGFSHVVPDGSWKAGPNQPGVAETYDPKRAVEAIEKAKAEADLVVVIVHWGEERKEEPNPKQVDMAYRYIDAGADLVVGGHPHVLQGFERYNGKWIAYSLGNFVFSTNSNERTWETIILEASCSSDGDCDLNAVPILTKFAHPVPMAQQEGNALLQRLSSLSIGAKVHSNGKVEAAVR